MMKQVFVQIHEAEFIKSSSKIDQNPDPNKPEYAFIGRSNVGKSSLINMLTNRNSLAKVSSTPGKTTLINHFKISDSYSKIPWYLVDLPGYGYAKRSQTQRKAWQSMIETYFKGRENLMNVFVLIDSRHAPQKIDLEFLAQLSEWEVPFSLVFTKSDKNKQAVTAKNVRQFIETMKKDWVYIPAHFVTSTVKKQGQQKILNFIGELNNEALEGEEELGEE